MTLLIGDLGTPELLILLVMAVMFLVALLVIALLLLLAVNRGRRERASGGRAEDRP